MKDPQRQKRVLELCELTLDAPADERDRLIKTLCGDDVELHSEVTSMLGRISTSESISDTVNPLQLGARGHAPTAGDSIAGFALQELIGTGGMGDVFRAVREDAAFEQEVAFKVLHAQILTPDLRLRFNQEREILARLRHPYIAGLIDGGTTPQGLPFLAMELVDGLPINVFCDKHQLSVRDRLALLEKVAAALQYAHQNLIIHRDIKPSNVLVTDDGIPKLLDFGIAKLLSAPDDEPAPSRHATTFFGNRALTPDYASPEQILDGTVSTASEVYSLGILALELLTGRKPYSLADLSARSLLESVELPPVPRASTLLVRSDDALDIAQIAQARHTSPSRLKRALTGDLDVVLATATHREPDRRYSSAQAFARDLVNVRTGAAVSARGDSLSYQTWSLIRTNRLAFSVVGATVVALSIGLFAALWQARIAEERLTDLHSFAHTVLGDIYDSVTNLPGSTPTRKLIADEAQHYLDRLADSGLDDPALQTDLAMAYKRLADVQGLPSNANLGETELALANYRRARKISESLPDNTPKNRKARAQIYRRMADVLAWQGEVEAARDELERSLAIFRDLHAKTPDDPAALVDLAYNLVKLGDTLGHPSFPNLADSAAATRAYAEGLALLEPHAEQHDKWELQRSYGVTLERAGVMALLGQDSGKALELFQRSRDVRTTLAAARPNHTDIQRDAGVASEKIADVLQADGNLQEALVHFRAALAVYAKLARIDPDNVNALRTLAIGRENLAEALAANGDTFAAREEYSAAEQLRLQLLGREPGSSRMQNELENTRARLAALQ